MNETVNELEEVHVLPHSRSLSFLCFHILFVLSLYFLLLSLSRFEKKNSLNSSLLSRYLFLVHWFRSTGDSPLFFTCYSPHEPISAFFGRGARNIKIMIEGDTIYVFIYIREIDCCVYCHLLLALTGINPFFWGRSLSTGWLPLTQCQVGSVRVCVLWNQ